jgi:hypothetical protein
MVSIVVAPEQRLNDYLILLSIFKRIREGNLKNTNKNALHTGD